MEILAPKKPHVMKMSDPRTDPLRKKAEAVAMKRIKEGKHKVDPEYREEYDRRIRSNPANIPGMPAFFPPIHIRSAMNDIRASRECECGGCAVANDGYNCPRCGNYVSLEG
jgi:hypothetical protein